MPAPENGLNPAPLPLELALIAGGGELPRQVAEQARNAGIDIAIIALKPYADDSWILKEAASTFPLGRPGKIIAWLKERKLRDLVLIGRLRRPQLRDVIRDRRAWKILFGAARMGWGDDALLKAVRHALEKEGFSIWPAQSLAPELMLPEGSFGPGSPSAQDRRDIDIGLETGRLLGKADIGQSVIVHQGVVLGVEAAEGTDALIERCAPLRTNGKGGVLVKICKPGQDRALDLPTIGPRTLKLLGSHGYHGLAALSGSTLISHIDDTRRAAAEENLFVQGLKNDI